MICINKSIRSQLAEKRISMFASIYGSDAAESLARNQQNDTALPQTDSKRTLHYPKPGLGVYKPNGAKHRKRRANKDRAYVLNPKDFKNSTQYWDACQERLRVEESQNFRKYHKEMIQTTFVGVDHYEEGAVL